MGAATLGSTGTSAAATIPRNHYSATQDSIPYQCEDVAPAYPPARPAGRGDGATVTGSIPPTTPKRDSTFPTAYRPLSQMQDRKRVAHGVMAGRGSATSTKSQRA